ncbi:MAG: arylsulfotransferase family protein [Rhodothalassiaceae bacterium]
MSDKLARSLFLLSLLMAAFGAGAAVVQFKVFPYYLARSIVGKAFTAYLNYGSYLGIAPTRWLRPAHLPGEGVTVADPARMQPGLTFMTSLFDEKVAMQLVDEEGKVVHRWIDTPSWFTNEIHGAVPLPDGSVVFSRADNGLRRIDKCGREMWHLDRTTHHSVFLSEDDQTLWVSARRVLKEKDREELAHLPGIVPPFTEEMALQVSLDGKVLREISLPRILYEAGLEGLMLPTGVDGIRNVDHEVTHLNDVEVLQRKDAAAFPMFEPGDLLVSFRNTNLLFVFNPDTGAVKWHQTGPWIRQHDPDFRPDGLISVFDNRKDDTATGSILGGSRILAVDPATGEVRELYRGSAAHPFFTNVLGKHQLLANGNILVSSGYQGRVFEVTPAGDIVWEYINRYDADRIILLHEGTRYPRDYFTVADWSCP